MLETNDKLCCLHRVSVRCRNYVMCSKSAFVVEKCVVFSELAFIAEIVLFAVNQRSLPKWCWLQWINVCYWNCVVCSESSFAVENCVICSELAFTAENYVICSELAFSAESCVVCSESPFAAENWVICRMLIRCKQLNFWYRTLIRWTQHNF